MGGRAYRLKFGHHGCNHPVKDLETTRVEITFQNHNFAVDPNSLDKSKIEITHINFNDMTVEGLMHKKEPLFLYSIILNLHQVRMIQHAFSSVSEPSFCVLEYCCLAS